MPDAIFTILISYLLGCFCTGYYLVLYKTGQDIRESGTGNLGARNVSRLLGRPGAVLTFIGDSSKGMIATGIALSQDLSVVYLYLVMFSVIAGHVWPLQLHFKGGKGFATLLGVLAVYHYLLLLALIVISAILTVVLRNSVVAGLIAASLLPLIEYFLSSSLEQAAMMSTISLLVLYAHRTNIREEWNAYKKKTTI